jgi:hypothetical protein
MTSRGMMSACAGLLAILGLAATFLPQEIVAASWAPDPANSRAALLLQIAGGLYLGFAILNWSVRDMVIGGIYNRPIVLGNLLHFLTVALALVRAVAEGDRHPGLLALTAIYGLFAAWFARTLLRPPTRDIEH